MLQISGDVTYNGEKFDTFLAERTSAYVDEVTQSHCERPETSAGLKYVAQGSMSLLVALQAMTADVMRRCNERLTTACSRLLVFLILDLALVVESCLKSM